MSKLLWNVLKISGGKCPKIPPPWLRACFTTSHSLWMELGCC